MTPLSLRDGLVRALCRPRAQGVAPPAYLVQLDAFGALVVVAASGRPLVLLNWPDDLLRPREVVLDRLQRVAQSDFPRGGDVVLVGGADEARALVASVRLDRRLRLHVVDLDGTIRDRTKPPRELATALREAIVAGDLGPLDRTEHASLVALQQQAAAQEHAFIERIRGTRPVATYALVAACVVVFLLELQWGNTEFVQLRMGATDGRLVRAGEWWRLVSGSFLHAGYAHIAMNMWSLWILGKFLEPVFGTPRYLVLYAASALVAGGASAGLHPDTFSVGASGAIFGLLGALAALAFGRIKLLPPSRVAYLRRVLGPVIVLNVGISLMPEIDSLAHLGGAVAGLALVWSGLLIHGLRTGERSRVASRAGWLFAATLSVALLATCEAMAFTHGRPWEIASRPKLVARDVPGTPLTVLLPMNLVASRTSSEGGRRHVLFGEPSRDPIFVEVDAMPSSGSLDAADEAELARPDEDASVTAPVKQEPLGAPTATSTELLSKRLTVLRTISYRGGWRVEADVVTTDALPPNWSGLGRDIVRSIAVH